MDESAHEFVASEEQYDLLRAALRTLIGEGIRPDFILKLAGVECDRGVVAKFCKPGGTRRINPNVAKPLWAYIRDTRPVLLGLPSVSKQPVFQALAAYYDAIIPMDKIIDGRYRFYQYSEEFNNYSTDVPYAIIVGEFRIVSQDGAITVRELQRYNGHLGKPKMTEAIFHGCCFLKNTTIIFLMKDGRGIPKFYVFPFFHTEGSPEQVQIMKGYMLKASHTNPYFHSPVYVLRVSDDEPIICNIVKPDDIDTAIFVEFARELLPVERVIRKA